MSADKTVIFITGASRGIGRGLAEAYLARPDHIVIGSVRDTSSASVDSLKAVKAASGSSLQIVKIEAKSDTDPFEAVKAIQAAGITYLDIVIANSGISGSYSRLDAANIQDFREYLEVNAVGPLVLYKAVFPLLKAAVDKKRTAPKFLGITTNASSIQNVEENVPYLLGNYGASKAALNYIVRRLSFENKWLTAFLMNPGFVQTDMGNDGAKFFGMEKAFHTIEYSVNGITKKLDESTPESTSGNFYDIDGKELLF
ncbi:toxin biosynthesis [Seiridium cupressi]